MTPAQYRVLVLILVLILIEAVINPHVKTWMQSFQGKHT